MSVYKKISDYCPCIKKENFFVSYAVRGSIVNPNMGLRGGTPVDYPLCGPVKEPSPLNNRCEYSKSCPNTICKE